MTQGEARAALIEHGRSLFERGYSCGSSGNLSVRLRDGSLMMTPTNASLGRLDARRLSRVDEQGNHLSGDPPTKEAWLHLAMYRSRPDDHAIVHLHSTYAVALSCRTDRNPADALPALTPYVVMRVGRVAMIPYCRPGDGSVADAVAAAARDHRSILLANHGPAVAARTLDAAVATAEELEETARLFFILESRPHQVLTGDQVADLTRVFGQTGDR